ncbi:hypothetical protein [Methylomarinovum tepidoasis]|uniref:hypothetical protein n=1 Tax=Methylomarinovum tepidoasis TaxID=2840183 RepID=UPI002574193C|nr:hypothetical protein [Methylomarinovum sp. IN45]
MNWDRLAGLLDRVDGLTWGVITVNLVLILFARHLVRLASGHDTPPALLRLRGKDEAPELGPARRAG